MFYPNEVKRIMDILAQNGKDAYLVGGCLRNILMGKEPHDWDMTTSALPHECFEIFKNEGLHVIETGIKHGTVTVIINSLPVEITTFRIDGSYGDSRHPDEVTFTPCIEEDLARRDFTVNAMAYNEKKGLVDLYGGKADLGKMLLRAVGEPERRFGEDALRILRAFRFASEHGFEIEEKTRDAIIQKRDGLKRISRERIYSELCRALLGSCSENAMKSLCECGIMPYIFEEYEESFAPRLDILSSLPRMIEPRLAALLVLFPEDEAERALSSLKMSNKERIGTKKLLEAVRSIKNEPFSDAVSARKFICRFGDASSDSALLAFLLGYDNGVTKQAVEDAGKEVFPRKIGDLAIDGSKIISLGASGKMTGEVLSYLLDEAVKNPDLNYEKELCGLAKKYILENKNEHCNS